MTVDLVVIGGGLFGSVIRDHCTMQGITVTMLNEERRGAGSKPAACLMKPSWYSGLGPEVYEPSLRVLDDLYHVQTVKFQVGFCKGPRVGTDVFWVPPSKILRGQSLRQRVTDIRSGLVTAVDTDGVTKLHHTRAIVVATGVWANELLRQVTNEDVPGLSARAGSAFLYRDLHLEHPFISPWAPYKQTVGFNRGDGVWVGDGTAIKPENLSFEREQESMSRCWNSMKDRMETKIIRGNCETLTGQRPYVPKVKGAWVKRVTEGIWVATGGAKNGTIGAGWCAHVIGSELS